MGKLSGSEIFSIGAGSACQGGKEPGFSNHKVQTITWDLVKCRLCLSRSGIGPRFCISNKLPSEAVATETEAVLCLARAEHDNMIPTAWPSLPSKLTGVFILVSPGGRFRPMLKGMPWTVEMHGPPCQTSAYHWVALW